MRLSTRDRSPLERLTIDDARELHGRVVTVTFVVAKPLDYRLRRTIVGADDQPDAAERGAYLAGKRFDIEEGQRITVIGTLRVIDWGKKGKKETSYIAGNKRGHRTLLDT